MTVHKLTAGDGYTYLTRQVASGDERRLPGQSLADYYTARGNPPGVWMGQGSVDLGVAGGEVLESQMRALFGRGGHPDGESKLGVAYPDYADLAPYSDRVAARVVEFEAVNGRPPSQAARNHFAAMEARRGRRAVAGYDLVFTPVKSVSLLWALGGPEIRAAVEQAHRAAVANTISWVEREAAYTRVGRCGTAQIDATGLVCAAFEHRESRAGDPDLHTHVAVANKVCGVDGKWRSLDARILYALGVAASERYNTRIEDELARRLGVEFVDRPSKSGKRVVREIAGIPSELIQHFSRRRAAIEERSAELRSNYRSTHGREPDRATQLQLAQQATLETRDAKGLPRTLAQQVEQWQAEARSLLGPSAFHQVTPGCLGRTQNLVASKEHEALARRAAAQVVRIVSAERSTWTVWNLRAETERLLRPVRVDSTTAREELVAHVVEFATSPAFSIRIRPPELVAEPAELVRASDGESVFFPHGADRFTTGTVLAAEDALVQAARTGTGPCVDRLVVRAALMAHETSTGLRLDDGQRQLVAAFAQRRQSIVVGIGPAGAGKTTAMVAFAEAWETSGGRVIPLATSAKAADVLGTELGMRAENLHKFLHENRKKDGDRPHRDGWFDVHAGDVLLVDEAGMAGTLQLAELLALATTRGAAIRLIGDPAQLAAVDAGGALKLLEHEAGATYLTDLHRFTDPQEGEATLRLRCGDPSALGFYRARDRIQAGSRDAMLEAAYDGWAADIRGGHVSVLIAATSDDVAALNARARTERVLAGHVEPEGIDLSDGNLAGVGDWVATRTNQRTLTWGRGRWVRNGDTWRITELHDDGSMTARPLVGRGQVRLPADYVATSVELAYACTAHRAQGSTTDTAHALVTPEMTREALYVASTRGRDHTTWYTAIDQPIDIDCHSEPAAPATATEVLTGILKRSSAEDSATLTIRRTTDEAGRLPALIAQYDHSLKVAADHVGHEGPTEGAQPDHRVRAPLPWLSAPSVSHPAWDTYLAARAELIRHRATELGSPVAVYREAYGITTSDPEDLGSPPMPETRQAKAFEIALASLSGGRPSPRRGPTSAPVPVRRDEYGRTDNRLIR